jgi:uncharacterized protein (TIGR03435 family)
MPTEELLALGVFERGSALRERVEMLLERGREFSPRVSRARLALSTIALAGCVVAGSIAPRLIAFAQQPVFEVASVKPNHSGVLKWATPAPVGGRYTATNVSLGMLLMNAYGVFPFQISGGPAWLNSDRFDLEGKAEGNPTREQFMLMLRSLMADRFKLALRQEKKEMPVYEMTVVKGGVKFKEAKCMGQPGPSNPCGGFSVSLGGSIVGRAAGVPELAGILSNLVSRTVVDKTGLTGSYDIGLKWTPDESTIRGPGDPDAPPPDSNSPSIFTALQEQLGLELKSAKGPVEMLVIDHAEKPDAN